MGEMDIKLKQRVGITVLVIFLAFILLRNIRSVHKLKEVHGGKKPPKKNIAESLGSLKKLLPNCPKIFFTRQSIYLNVF